MPVLNTVVVVFTISLTGRGALPGLCRFARGNRLLEVLDNTSAAALQPTHCVRRISAKKVMFFKEDADAS